MADDRVTFGINLESNAPEVASDSAAALQSLHDKIQGDIVALRQMNQALRNLQGGSAVNIATMRDLKDKISAQKAVIAQAQQKYIDLGGSFRRTSNDAKSFKEKLSGLLENASKAQGPLGSLAGRLGGLSKIVAGGAVAIGILGIAAAVTALAVATGAAIGSLLKYGIAQADARRSELLRLEGLTKIRYWLQGLGGIQIRAADKASFLQDSIDKVSASVALGRDRVAQYATELYRAGLRGGNLQAALEGVSTTAAVQGEEQAGIFKSWAMGAALTGQSVRRLADDVKARLGGIARQQMLSLDVQVMKLKENFALLFKDLKIGGFLEALNGVLQLFSQATATGRALKAIVEAIFPNFTGQADGAAIVVKRFFQGMVIGALQVTIAILKVRNWLRNTFAESDWIKKLDTGKLALRAGEKAFRALAIGVGAAAGAFVLLTAAVAGALSLSAFAIGKFIDLTVFISEMTSKFYNWALDLGGGFLRGIVEGIKSGTVWVKDAILNLGSQMVGWFKDKLKIHSPSRLTRDAVGLPTGQGIAVGLGDARPLIRGAAQRAASAAVPDSIAPTARASNGVSGGASLTVGNITVVIQAASGAPQDLEAAVKRGVRQALEEAAIQMGARKAAA